MANNADSKYISKIYNDTNVSLKIVLSKKSLKLFLTKICKNVLQSGSHLEYFMLRPYISFLISEMKSRVLNKDVLLIKVSNTDGRMLILHYIGILSFFMAAILKTIQNGG